jgi:P27 family predicted phage terminase small subunit
MATRNVRTTAGKKTPQTGVRKNRAKNELAAALNPDKPIYPFPPDLPEHHKKIWTDIVNTKTSDYWTRGDEVLLRMYCRNAADVDRLNDEIELEGEVLYNGKGNPVVNPKLVIRGFAEARLMTLASKLRMQPSSRVDRKVEANATTRKKQAGAAAAVIMSAGMGEDDGDGLLAGGVLQ